MRGITRFKMKQSVNTRRYEKNYLGFVNPDKFLMSVTWSLVVIFLLTRDDNVPEET